MPSDLDLELRRVAHALVADAPAPLPFPRLAVRPHARRVLGWRVPAAALAATAALVVAALAGMSMSDRSADTSTVAVGPRPSNDVAPNDLGQGSPTPAPQRLLVRGGREVAVDGSTRTVPLDLPGVVAREIEPTTDGRLVVLGSRDLAPGVARTDGPNVDALANPLIVVRPDGSVAVDRDVRVPGETVALLAVTGDEAILRRSGTNSIGLTAGPARVVAHDLPTGRERQLFVAPNGVWGGDAVGATLALLTAGPNSPNGNYAERGPCAVEILSIATGRVVQGPLPDCSFVQDIRIGPDERRAAVVYGMKEAVPSLRLAIVDLEARRVVSDQLLGYSVTGCPPGACEAGAPLRDYLGMAWMDSATLRLALTDLTLGPPNASGNTPPTGPLIETRKV